MSRPTSQATPVAVSRRAWFFGYLPGAPCPGACPRRPGDRGHRASHGRAQQGRRAPACGVRLAARPVSLMVGLGADYVHRVSAELGGERIHVVQWQGDPARYIADALGLGYLPPIEVSPSRWLANVLLGDIDVRGARGRQGVNLLLAS